MTSQQIFKKMLEIAQLDQTGACIVANGIHPDDYQQADAFASEIGGYDIVAAKFPELLAGAKHERAMTAELAATLLGVTAITVALGHKLHV